MYILHMMHQTCYSKSGFSFEWNIQIHENLFMQMKATSAAVSDLHKTVVATIC